MIFFLLNYTITTKSHPYLWLQWSDSACSQVRAHTGTKCIQERTHDWTCVHKYMRTVHKTTLPPTLSHSCMLHESDAGFAYAATAARDWRWIKCCEGRPRQPDLRRIEFLRLKLYSVRAQGKKASPPIYKILVCPGPESNSRPISTEVNAPRGDQANSCLQTTVHIVSLLRKKQYTGFQFVNNKNNFLDRN